MRLGVLGAVLVALPRDVADRLLEVLARLADMHLIDRGREPRCLELVLVDARVLQALLVGFEHQFLGAAVPAFAELRATHAENSDLVLDAPSHGRPPVVGLEFYALVRWKAIRADRLIPEPPSRNNA